MYKMVSVKCNRQGSSTWHGRDQIRSSANNNNENKNNNNNNN